MGAPEKVPLYFGKLRNLLRRPVAAAGFVWAQASGVKDACVGCVGCHVYVLGFQMSSFRYGIGEGWARNRLDFHLETLKPKP